MGVSNLEARILKLENTSKNEFGIPANFTFFPVRKLMLAEETSHDEDGVAYSVLVATWDKPAGVLLPDSIRLIHNDTTVLLAGSATSYRMTGYTVGVTVSVKVTSIYSQGNSSTVIAEKTISGDVEPPSVPTNLTVSPGFRTLTLRWENPTSEDFSHVEIWESVTDNNLNTAERIAQAYGTEFVRSNCAVLETRWYWIRALDENGNYSDFTNVVSGVTNAIQASDVPENTITDSMLTDTLEQKINDSKAAIEIVDDVRIGDVNVFRQTTAPTEGMITGDLWIDNAEAVYRYEGGSWVSKAGTPVYDLLKAAIAQYVVKTQTVTGDGKLKVAGFGLFNDATTGSEFAVLADKFYVYAQKEDGSSYTNVQVFTIDTTATPPTVGINGNLIVAGSITGEKINSAAQITLGDGGEFITGTGSIVQMASGVIILDSENGIIQVRDPANVSTGDYIKIETGDIFTYKYMNGAYYPMKSLRKMVTGANVPNNVELLMPEVFPAMPNIFVSPCNLQCYDPYYSLQKQSLLLQATDIDYNSSTGECSFTPQAELVVTSGSGNVSAISSGSVSTGTATITDYNPDNLSVFEPVTVTLDTKTIPANVSTLSVSAKIYAQAMHNDKHGTTFGYCLVPHIIDYVIYAKVGGIDYLVGSGTITRPTSLIDISSEPTNYYISKSMTITVNTTGTTNVILWAEITPRDDVGTMDDVPSYALGYASSPISPTPYNKAWLACASASYILASATLIAEGTLNYMAISE